MVGVTLEQAINVRNVQLEPIILIMVKHHASLVIEGGALKEQDIGITGNVNLVRNLHSFLSQATWGPGAYRDRSCHKKSQRHVVLGLHNSFY